MVNNMEEEKAMQYLTLEEQARHYLGNWIINKQHIGQECSLVELHNIVHNIFPDSNLNLELLLFDDLSMPFSKNRTKKYIAAQYSFNDKKIKFRAGIGVRCKRSDGLPEYRFFHQKPDVVLHRQFYEFTFNNPAFKENQKLYSSFHSEKGIPSDYILILK